MFYYSSDKNVQMIVYLMKEHGIKKIVISPGTSHIGIIASFQCDPFFEIYSEIDERNAAYLACGLSMESGEPVALACTGATASRNYLPGLSEAFYRKLPILAITGAQDDSNAGNLIPQYIDRSIHPVDAVRYSVRLQQIKDSRDEWDCNLKINKALLELTRKGGGPVHINLNCNAIGQLMTQELPETRVINRYIYEDKLPEIKEKGRIAVSVGGHKPWTDYLTELVDCFCEKYNAVVFVDHSSNYRGKYRVLPTIVSSQEKCSSPIFDIDLLIHIGEQSGDYYTFYKFDKAKTVWRVSPDGELRDTFHHLTKVFEMSEEWFFKYYTENMTSVESTEKVKYLQECKKEISDIQEKIPVLPFSNISVSQYISTRMPENCSVHLGVSNTQRAWTFFELPNVYISTANVGCRGIDGALSSVLGMSLVDTEKIHFCFLGDLTFFYNMNALGNRSVLPNLRILLINNGSGAEFHMYSHPGRILLKDDVNSFVAASGHFSAKSKNLVKAYVENLGFEYLSAANETELKEACEKFLDKKKRSLPIVLEVFTECDKESEALQIIRNIRQETKSQSGFFKKAFKHIQGVQNK